MKICKFRAMGLQICLVKTWIRHNVNPTSFKGCLKLDFCYQQKGIKSRKPGWRLGKTRNLKLSQFCVRADHFSQTSTRKEEENELIKL